MQCPECDKVFEKRGFRNHLLKCGKTPVSTGKLTPLQAWYHIINTILSIDVRWLLPEANLLSVLFYVLIVYPMMYVFVWRMLIQPVLDIITVSLYWAKYIASWYNMFGFIPDSVPKDTFFEKTQMTNGTVDFWSLVLQFATFLRP